MSFYVLKKINKMQDGVGRLELLASIYDTRITLKLHVLASKCKEFP